MSYEKMIAILTLAITEASMEAENGADAATAVLSLMMMKSVLLAPRKMTKENFLEGMSVHYDFVTEAVKLMEQNTAKSVSPTSHLSLARESVCGLPGCNC